MAKKKLNFANGFVAIPHDLIRSKAFRSLSGNACAIFLQMADVWSEKNPDIAFGARHAAKLLGIHPDTAKKALLELQEKGFIVKTVECNYYQKRAREYRLTYREYNGKQPTNDYLAWTKENTTNGLKNRPYTEEKLGRYDEKKPNLRVVKTNNQ